MTIVNQGSSAIIDVAIGQKIAVSTPGEAYVDILAGTLGAGYTSKRLADNAKEQTFGPYGSTTRLQVRAVAGAATFGEAVEQAAEGGASEFKMLADAPNTYAGQSSMVPRVKADQSGLEFLPSSRKSVRFVDADFYAPSTDTADISAAPYNGTAAVGDDVLILYPDTANDSGIWTISAINGNAATLVRRNDSQAGAFFTVGEVIYEYPTGSGYVCSAIYPIVGGQWGDSIASGTLDGVNALQFTPIVSGDEVTKALKQITSEVHTNIDDTSIAGALASRVRLIEAGVSGLGGGVALADAAGGNITLVCGLASDMTMPKKYGNTAGYTITVRRIDTSGNTVTIQMQGSDTINGAASMTVAPGQSVRFVSDGVSKFWTI